MTKPNKMTVHPAKTQISLGIRQTSLCAQWVAKDPSFLHVDSKDSDSLATQSFCWFCHEAAHMFLWRTVQNYPLIITKYPPYLFHCSKDLF